MLVSDDQYCIDCNNPIYTLQHKDNVPKSFPLPLFDPRQYANMAGEGLGYLVTCNDVRSADGRHTEGIVNNELLIVYLLRTFQHSPLCSDVSTRMTSTFFVGQSTVCLPSVCLMAFTLPDLPGLPPPYLQTASNEMLVGGNGLGMRLVIVPNAHPYTTGSNTSLQQPKTFTWGTYTPGRGKIVPVHVPAPTFMCSSGNVIFSNTQHNAVYMCAIRSSMPSRSFGGSIHLPLE